MAKRILVDHWAREQIGDTLDDWWGNVSKCVQGMFLPWHNEEPKWQSVNSLELHLIDKICGFSNTTAACLVIYVSNVGYLQVFFGFLQLSEASTTCRFPIR